MQEAVVEAWHVEEELVPIGGLVAALFLVSGQRLSCLNWQ